jgi:lipid II:glycine glycyltransferase (peptidoglycan interpeptide bridge formation enzyme)
MNANRPPEYVCEVSSRPHDPEWDAFLESVPGSQHLQTSLWAQLKSPDGWRAHRAVVRSAGRIVGGFQMFHRKVSIFGRAGYIPRGPVWVDDEVDLRRLLLDQIIALARAEHLSYLSVQATRNSARFADELLARGFRPSAFQVAPTATVLVDLTRSEAELHANLRSSVRRALRRAAARGVTVRIGSAGDLPAFHALLAASAQRHRFAPPALEYFRKMWDLFSRTDDIVLFITERNGEPVAAELDIAFGDTLVSKRAGWSGRHGDCNPNEMLVWSAMLWAKKNGRSVYDLDGMDPDVAGPLARGETIPPAIRNSRHEFKLGFGGDVVLLADTYEWFPSPIARSLHRAIWAPLLRSRRMRTWARRALGKTMSLNRKLRGR